MQVKTQKGQKRKGGEILKKGKDFLFSFFLFDWTKYWIAIPCATVHRFVPILKDRTDPGDSIIQAREAMIQALKLNRI